MFISYRPASFLSSLPSLFLSGAPLQLVSEFKYLGVTLTSSLSWTTHISSVCAKSRRLLGLLYRRFYTFSDSPSLLKLYSSLIRPHLEYCSFLWDPHSSHLSSQLEKIQFFAAKICSKDRKHQESESSSSSISLHCNVQWKEAGVLEKGIKILRGWKLREY